MSEETILKICSYRSNLEKYKKILEPLALTEESRSILKGFKLWFKEKEEEDEIDWDPFIVWYQLKLHYSWDKDKKAAHAAILRRVKDVDLSTSDAKELLASLIEKTYAIELANIALDIADGRPGKTLATTLYEKFEDFLEEADKDVVDPIASKFLEDPVEEVLKETIGIGGLTWRLQQLNDSLGKLRKGDFIILAGRPDSGKTSFLASEVSFMAMQLEEEEYVLWFNNEERKHKVKRRIIQAALGRKDSVLNTNLVKTQKDYLALFMDGQDHIKLYDDSVITESDMRRAIKKYNPGLIIIDQLAKVVPDKMSHSSLDNVALKTTRVANLARQLAKEYCPVIGTVWADASAEGEEFIQMNQLYEGKTGLPGEADAIITLGKSNDEDKTDFRYINIPKNKMSSDKEDKRNAKYVVVIKKEIARFE